MLLVVMDYAICEHRCVLLLASFALWCAWRVSEHYLDGEKRVAALLLLTFIPFFNFHALKYNANTVLIPLWAVATWCFLRSYETRSALWAALAGLGAAAAMMGKYWSIFLLAGLVLAALIDRRRMAYFRSLAPWVTVLVGGIALAPHIAWLVANNFSPFTYAVDAHLSNATSAAWSGLSFLIGAFGYAAPPLVMWLIVARPRPAALADTIWPTDDPRRLVVLSFILPLILPCFAAIAVTIDIVSLWAMCAMTLLGVVLLSSPLIRVSRRATTWLLGLAVVFPLLVTLASPIIAIVIHRQGVPNYGTHYRLLAAAVDRAWRETTDKPMRYFGSYTNTLNGVSFYLKDHPSALDITDPRATPWSDEASVARAGIALACPEPEAGCMQKLNERAGNLPRHAATLSRRHLGVADAPVRYVIVVVPPHQ